MKDLQEAVDTVHYIREHFPHCKAAVYHSFSRIKSSNGEEIPSRYYATVWQRGGHWFTDDDGTILDGYELEKFKRLQRALGE